MTSVETLQEEGYQLAPQQLARSSEAGSVAVRVVRTAMRITVPVLETRMTAAVAQYEILRTRYTELAPAGTLVQVVERAGPVEIEQSGTERTVLRGGSLIVEHEPGPDGTRLTLTLPCLSVDDASWSRLVGILLEGAAVDEDDVLQYADAAAWIGEVLEHSAQPTVDEPTWRPTSALPFLQPVDRGDSAAEPVSCSAVVEGPALDRLAEFSARCGVSEAAVLLALWRALHVRYSRDSDDQVVVLSDGRSTEGLESVLGLLERPVPVRLEMVAETTVADALRSAQHALRSAVEIENQVDPGAVASGGTNSYRHREDRWAGELSPEVPVHDVRGPLHLDCVRGPRSLRLTFVGTAGRVTQADLGLFAEAYCCQLADLSAGGVGRAISRLRLTAPITSIAPVEPSVHHASVLDRFLRQSELTPERPALRCGETVISYRDAALRADAVARLLRDHGVQAGQRVALPAPASAETIVAMLGIWLVGAAFVPIDPGWPQQRTEVILREADPALLLAADPKADYGTSILTVCAADAAVASDRPLPTGIDATGAAYVIFTSGTSGVPKGVVIGHDQVAHYAAAIGGKLGLPEGAEFAAVSTLAADLAYTAIFPTLASGGCVQLIPAETATNPAALSAWFRAHPAAAMKLVPSHLSALLAEAADPLALLPGEALVLGGELLPRPLYERLREIAPVLRVHNHYGPTETTVGASCVALNGPVDERCFSIPVGDGLGANVLTVVDEVGVPVPPWCPGEVVVSGPGVGLGYLARLRAGLPGFADADAEDGYRTGDLGRLVPGAGVEILGRIDDQVKLRGYRVQVGEIEALLTGQPGIGAAAVVPRADDDGLTTHLDAYLVGVAGAPAPSVELIRAAVGDWLPAALTPTGWQVLERLPLTGNGKLDRRALAPIEPPVARAGRPRDSVEQRLVAIWSSVLDQDVSSPDAHFFELGGQSLRAIKLMARINKAFNCDLPMSTVFNAPTAAAMATLMRGIEIQDSILVPLRVTRESLGGATIFCVHLASGNTLSYWELARALPADRSVFGVESRGLHGHPAQRDFAAMAEEYAAAIAAVSDGAPVIIGWGFGGIMAHATARALRGSGHEVARLIIVDSTIPDHEAGDPIRRFAVHHELDLPAGAPDTQYLLKALQSAGGLPPDAGEAQLQTLLDVFAANTTALDRYIAQQRINIGSPDFGHATVAADHHGIMRRPAVTGLAELIGRALGQEGDDLVIEAVG